MTTVTFALPAAVVLSVALYTNWDVLNQPPYYDEMWRMNLITARDTFAQLLAFDTPIPVAWLYLNKALLFATPEGFGLARTLSTLWLAIAASLLAWTLSDDTRDWNFIAGALLMATCTAIQWVTRHINQYSFEVLYSVAIVAISMMPLDSTRHRLVALTVLILTPLATITSTFFIPGALLVMFLRARTRRVRLELIATGYVIVILSLAIYVFVYRPIILQHGAGIEYWSDRLVTRDPAKYIAALTALPRQIAISILGDLPNDATSRAVVIAIVLFLIGLGLSKVWQRSHAAALTMACAAVIALAIPFIVTWPLELWQDGVGDERRVHLGWSWLLYFCFGVGIATALSRMLQPAYSAAGVCAILLVILVHSKSFVRHSPDRVAFRELYKDISAVLSEPKPPQMVVSFHFMARCYLEFLTGLKKRDNMVLAIEPRVPEEMNNRFLSEIMKILKEHPEVQRIAMFYPFERGPKFWDERVKDFSLPGFARRERRTEGSNVVRFERYPNSSP
jgi:hypothetical protein